jgi:putative nucleotidyltransferase with HDIG domain
MIDSYDLHDMVDALTAALDAKNPYTCGHSGRVAELALALACQLGLPDEERNRIHVGAHLHDIGKIGVPDRILDKPAGLTEAEMSLIKLHPIIGDQIIRKTRAFQPMADIVRHHHERFDGKGYPDGLSGLDISLGARIVAVADAVDAMTNPRPYRKALSFQDASDELMRCRNRQFDPELVDIMVGYLSEAKL